MLFKSKIYEIIDEETNKVIKKVSDAETAKSKANALTEKGVDVKVVVDGETFYDPDPMGGSNGFMMGDCYDARGEVDGEVVDN